MFLIFTPLFIGLYFFKSSSRFWGIFSFFPLPPFIPVTPCVDSRIANDNSAKSVKCVFDMFFVFAPLFIGLYFFKSSSRFWGIFSLICFVFSLLCFAFFIMADKPKFHGSIIAFEGLTDNGKKHYSY